MRLILSPISAYMPLAFRICADIFSLKVHLDILPTAKAGGFLLRDGNALPRECS